MFDRAFDKCEYVDDGGVLYQWALAHSSGRHRYDVYASPQGSIAPYKYIIICYTNIRTHPLGETKYKFYLTVLPAKLDHLDHHLVLVLHNDHTRTTPHNGSE